MRTIVAAIGLLVAAVGGAGAAEIKGLVSTALKPVIDELVPAFERATGHKLIVSYGPTGPLSKRLGDGEQADLIVVSDEGIDTLIKQGKVSGSRIDMARTEVGVAVGKGAPKPDISSSDAVKRTLLAAKSVAYVGPTSGGVTNAHLMKMYDKLGIASEVAAKSKHAAGGPNGRVSTLVANGTAEIGLQQISELMSEPSVDVVGRLPEGLRILTVYSAGIPANAKEADAARALLKHLTAPSAATVWKAKGLDPS
jgi:molybdate transport system substrate-binding protein